MAEILAHQHFVILWKLHSTRGERADLRGHFAPYSKHPNTLSTGVPGILPAVRTFTKSEVVVSAFDPAFIASIEEELDMLPVDSLHEQKGVHDQGSLNLMSLLITEAEAAAPYGKLYSESLGHALATRYVYFGRARKQPEIRRELALPHRLLQRVTERMKSDFRSDLSLAALAAESGYSRAHFLRMFRAATGQTPHRYLLELRIENALSMMKDRSKRLIDIASASGFSSHDYFTKAFRGRFGMTPSQYRRNM
jgi:AraC family transcriptional regulator